MWLFWKDNYFEYSIRLHLFSKDSQLKMVYSNIGTWFTYLCKLLVKSDTVFIYPFYWLWRQHFSCSHIDKIFRFTFCSRKDKIFGFKLKRSTFKMILDNTGVSSLIKWISLLRLKIHLRCKNRWIHISPSYSIIIKILIFITNQDSFTQIITFFLLSNHLILIFS